MRRWIAGAVLLASCRGVSTSYSYPEDLTHPNYVKRTKATRQFASSGDESRLPGAFALLLDEEAHIRAIAYRAIRKMMPERQDFGYRPFLPEADRIRLVAEWEAWWRLDRGETAGG